MRTQLLVLVCVVFIFCTSLSAQDKVQVSGELKAWHNVTLTFDGPEFKEGAGPDPNPFLNVRMNVYFTNGRKLMTVPGYFAADGHAGDTGAAEGNKWRVHFAPSQAGTWTYVVSFREGPNITVSTDPGEGSPGVLDGLTGTIKIGPTDKNGRDFRAKGLLEYVGQRYFRFAGTGENFLIAGSMSPENPLGYYEFDNTYDTKTDRKVGETAGEVSFIHYFKPHAKDWKSGDPTWKDGKGKNIIGALNYLASKGMNSMLFLPYNLDGGDGHDTWMWNAPNTRIRFDCSKLDQWEVVFSHMEKLGIVLHVLTSEAENVRGLDGGDLGIERKLYYREFIARFGHHLGLIWNLGEENNNSSAQQRAYCAYLKHTDPYRHPILTHTFPGQRHRVYTALLGYPHFEGASLQMDLDGSGTHAETLKWLERSALLDHQWIVQADEYGHGGHGVMPDDMDATHDEPRKNVLWGNLMAGGGGAHWYFGYKYHSDDLRCEDWRTRDTMWDQTRYAIEFFHTYLPFHEMSSADDLVSTGWCFAKQGEIYAVYLPEGGTAELKLKAGDHTVQWFNPRKGGNLQNGSVAHVTGPGSVSVGNPPRDPDQDWVVLCQKK